MESQEILDFSQVGILVLRSNVKLLCKELNKRDDQWIEVRKSDMESGDVQKSGGVRSWRDLASTYVLRCLATSCP